MTYRREIDGLRAIAVAAVVLYHAGFGPAAGFVGVDVFFVISGYLITALLIREKSHTGRIDLADFYARRVRRIFPAAAVVLLAVLAVVPILPESSRAGVQASAAAASVFGANVYFQLATGGYFTGDAGQLPLLHLWSLSVEEQFYLLWPAVLMLGAGRRTFAVIAVASFVLCEWLLLAHPNAAFYQMPARAWELAAGALIATMPARAMPRWTAWAGLCAVVVACLVPLPHFPGAGALPAVAGAALLLSAIHGGATNALLASRPFVGVGLISYSLYLWHWPLLAIDRLLRVGPSPWETRALLVGLAVLLAFASYRYIETPLRKPWGTSRRTVVAGFAMMALIGGAAWKWAPVAPPDKIDIRSQFLAAKCRPFVAGEPVSVQRPACFTTEPKVVMVGDSYANAWEPLVEHIGTRQGMAATTFARNACPPVVVPGLDWRSPREAASCAKWNRDTLVYLRANRADTLVVALRWDRLVMPQTDAGPALEQFVADVTPSVGRILIIAPTPVLADRVDKCAELGSDCAIARSTFDASAEKARAILRRLAENPKVTVDEPADWLCSADSCAGFRDGVALYEPDGAHVTPATAARYGAELAARWPGNSIASHQLSSQ